MIDFDSVSGADDTELFSKTTVGVNAVGLVGFLSIESNSADDIFTFEVEVDNFEPVAAEAKLPVEKQKRMN